MEGGGNAGGGEHITSKTLAGIVVDDTKAKLTGEWGKGSGPGIDEGYLHDMNQTRERNQARFEITVPQEGRYEVRLAYTPNPNRATKRAGDGGGA